MRRSIIALGAIGLVASAAVAIPAAANGRDTPRRLNILLTNDDGWRGVGGASTPHIVNLRNALVAAGHSVVVVATDNDASGTGTKFSVPPATPSLLVNNPEAHVYTVSGPATNASTPADAVFIALRSNLLANREPGFVPDLVVSGPNPGGNFSYIANHSGTVGAATTALELGIPAVAISMDFTFGVAGGSAVYGLFSPVVADYTTRVVGALAKRAGDHGELLPDGIALSINYPTIAVDSDGNGSRETMVPAKGARVTSVERSNYINLAYSETAVGSMTYTFGATVNTEPAAKGSDREALHDGYISIAPISADRSAKSGHHFKDLTKLGV
jgi:5'-nucleotidase